MMAKVKIFLVDDDLFNLNIYREGLDNLGFNDISLFLNGVICLNNLYQKPDIIFLDYHLDNNSGFDILKKIKRHNSDIYVIIIAIQENTKIATDALKYGAFDYITKGDDEITKMKNVIERISCLKQNSIKK